MSPQAMHILFVLIQVGPVILIFVAGSFLVSRAFKKRKQEKIQSDIHHSNILLAAEIPLKNTTKPNQMIVVREVVPTDAQRQSLSVKGDVHIPGATQK